MAWFTYEIGPIDFGWGGTEPIESAAVRIAGDEARSGLRAVMSGAGIDDEEDVGLRSFLERYKSAWSEVRLKESDLRQPPVVFWVPVENDFECGFVFKEDNNGTTYVVSPRPLPHLDSLMS